MIYFVKYMNGMFARDFKTIKESLRWLAGKHSYPEWRTTQFIIEAYSGSELEYTLVKHPKKKGWKKIPNKSNAERFIEDIRS